MNRPELLHFHPHVHVLHLRCVHAAGESLELAELDLERLQTAWQEAVFALYLAAAPDSLETTKVKQCRINR